MNIKSILIVTISILLLVCIYLYFDKTSELESEISLKTDEIENLKKENSGLNSEITKTQSQLEVSKNSNRDLNQNLESCNSRNEQLENNISGLKSKVSTYSYLLGKERGKISDAKNDLIVLINERMGNLLDHRIRMISIFKDDSSFTYFSGRRNMIRLESGNTISIERVVHFSSTGQYLKEIYQDKDNGNNRFLITNLSIGIDQIDLNKASIKENIIKVDPNAQTLREENYVSIIIPLKDPKTEINITESVEFQDKRYDKKLKSRDVEIYARDKNDAGDILGFLKMLSSLS